MKQSKVTVRNLVDTMKPLESTSEGHLKGGFAVIPASCDTENPLGDTNYVMCGCDINLTANCGGVTTTKNQ